MWASCSDFEANAGLCRDIWDDGGYCGSIPDHLQSSKMAEAGLASSEPSTSPRADTPPIPPHDTPFGA